MDEEGAAMRGKRDREPRALRFTPPDSPRRTATFVNDRDQRFRVTAAAPGEPADLEALTRLLKALRLYIEANVAGDTEDQAAAPEIPIDRALRETVSEAEAEVADSDEARGPMEVLAIELLAAPDIPEGALFEISVVVDPPIGRNERHCWVGRGDFDIDVRSGRVEVVRSGFPAVTLGEGGGPRGVRADGRCVVIGRGNSNRYAGDARWTRTR